MQGYYLIGGRAGADPERPFGPEFFRQTFPDYIRNACSLELTTTILEVVLANGDILDVSHIIEIDDALILLAVFVDTRSCDAIYRTYIRYDTILRINLIEESANQRPVGFNMSHEPKVSARAANPILNAATGTASEAAPTSNGVGN